METVWYGQTCFRLHERGLYEDGHLSLEWLKDRGQLEVDEDYQIRVRRSRG